MKYFLASLMPCAATACFALTEDEAIENWKAACIDAGGEYTVDFIQAGDEAKTPQIIFICEGTSSQAVRIVPAEPYLQGKFSAGQAESVK